MKMIDVLCSKECKPLFEEIQRFVSISLSEYNDTIEKNGFCCSDKDIFDFIWGTISFNAAEICILDSPLLQRLRRIRQLGLASMVYCNADSSRFSHTIGVTEVASRMAESIKSKVKYNRDGFDPVEVVRLAAIFHDTGHMFYSHVSEIFFTFNKEFPRYSELTALKSFFCEKTSSNASLHEIISTMIVFSKETIRLLKNVSQYLPNSRLREDKDYLQMAEYIACLIIGSPIDKFVLPYSTIINSSIDADKLDYLSRDSACTKVPIAVDISRIIQKLDVVDTKEILRSSIWNDTSSDTIPLKIMAIKSSAKKVFWQLSNARSSLFESVYHHHKVLTAESMFRNALQNLYCNKKRIDFCEIMLLTDDVFNEYWKSTPIKSDDIDDASAATIDRIFKMIRERTLYKRVAVFSMSILNGRLSDIGRFFRNVIQNPSSGEATAFFEELQNDYYIINSLLNPDYQIPKQHPIFMFISANYDTLSSIPFESGDGYCTWSSSLMKHETMEAGKKSRQEQFYLISDCIDRDIVYLALEKILCKRGITFKTNDSVICLKTDKSELDSKRIRLFEKDYYKDSLRVLNNEIFIGQLNERKIQSIVNKYQSFLGVESCKITEDSLLNFLRQFLWLELGYSDFNDFFDGILDLLEKAYYIDRETFNSQIKQLIEDLSSIPFRRKHIVNLGNVFDSSKHLMYYFNDIAAKKDFIFDTNLENALEQLTDNECLCFFDDGAYSGKQVISIFQEFMGVPLEERTTSEHHVDELDSENKKRLKSANIVLAYLCFNSTSREYILSELSKLGLTKANILFVEDLKENAFQKTEFKDENQAQMIKDYLKTIGIEIMKSRVLIEGEYKAHWDKDRVEKAALGYNDAQQMVFFSTSVPTYTIVAFWQCGKYKGNEWKGLFRRTIKD